LLLEVIFEESFQGRVNFKKPVVKQLGCLLGDFGDALEGFLDKGNVIRSQRCFR